MKNNIIRHIRKFIELNETEAVIISKYLETHHYKKKNNKANVLE